MSQRHTTLLPRKVDALKFTQREAALQGEMHLRDLPRLQQCLSDNIDSIVFADLQFGKDEENRRVMNGFLKTELSLQCNRCLQSMTLPMETGFHLAFVWNDEQAAALPKSLEPVFLHEESIDLYEILEDELLLSLPLSPVHASDICQIDQSFPVNPENEVSLGLLSGKQIKKEAERADNPFEVLAQLKRDSGKKPE